MKKVLFFLFNSIYIFASCQNAEPETYLIPSGFQGRVAIVLNQSKGYSKSYEKSRRVYRIDTTGVLLTQFGVNDGFINCQYFYVDSTGQRRILRNLENKNLIIDENEIGIFQSRTGIAYGSSGTPNSIDTQEFIVSTRKNLKLYTTPEYRKLFNTKLKKIVGHEF